MDAVTTVLQERARATGGLNRMVSVSLALHGLIAILLLVVPARLGVRQDDTRNVMTISLGGPVGPRAGGMTPMGGRPVQAVTPPDAPKRPEAVRPPAAKVPEMTMPAPNAKTRPSTTVKSAPDEARGRTPTKGPETRPGSSIAETGGHGTGFGLSTGGGGTGGYLDVGNFCCPEYITTMLQRIQGNWNAKQQVAGDVMVKFTIQRDGTITDVYLEQSSGFAALDLGAQRAVLITRQLPPLPAQFPNASLTVHLKFQYLAS